MSLILTVTRACNLRCSYCPTAKDGWPSLSVDQALLGLRLYAARGGGDVKLFGGEPLLVPEVVAAVMDEAEATPEIRRVYLSTNGLGLNRAWLARVARSEKSILTISLDGAPEDNRRFRRTLHDDVPDAYDHIMSLREHILRTPRVVITQTIPPASASRASQNFEHLLELGFRRFNLLPGYYIPWRMDQLLALQRGFNEIGERIREIWADGGNLYLRNLYTWAPTPFFNTGFVVDSDGTIHPSNLGLSSKLDDLRAQTQVGTLDDPPTPEALAEKAELVNQLLRDNLDEGVWESTQAVDALLTDLCRSLYGSWAERRRAAERVA